MRQRKFGFQTKLPGRKRPSSGDFSDLRSEARLRPRRPLSLPYGLGGTGRMLFWVPDQNNALRFSGFQPEARLRATLGQDAPHGRGVSDPSPCAPPRQALCTDPFEHSVEGFCGAARVEWAGPVWAKNRSGRAVTCVSLPPSQRRAPFRGIHKGYSPYVCFLPCFLHKQKTSRPPGRDRASSAACGTLLKKGKVLHRCTKRTPARGRTPRIPVPPAAHILSIK